MQYFKTKELSLKALMPQRSMRADAVKLTGSDDGIYVTEIFNAAESPRK